MATFDIVHPAPKGFQPHAFERSFRISAPISTVWDWLNRVETFTQGHPPGFWVEFVGDRFAPGVCTVHHGPFLNFAGVIGEMTEPNYRDLQYFYGSYALGMSLIRPVRLQFWLDVDGDGPTVVKLRVDSYVRSWMAPLWTLAQRMFWPGLGWQMRSALEGNHEA